jgi:serine/threonine protein kinase
MLTLAAGMGSSALTGWRIAKQKQASLWAYAALSLSLVASIGSFVFAAYQIRAARQKLRAVQTGVNDPRTLAPLGQLLFDRALAQRARGGKGANDEARIIQSFMAEHDAAAARAMVRRARKTTLAAHAVAARDITWCDGRRAPIATGRHSQVHRVQLRGHGDTVFAAKVLLLEGMDAMALPSVVESFQREAELMCRVSANPHNTRTIRIEGVCMELHNPVIVMELATRGSLRELLDAADMPSTADKLRAIHDIVAGMAQLHACEPPIGHRDLKSANVLVNGAGDCLIADFGLSKTIGNLVSGTATATGVVHQSFGTPQWSSPEYIQRAVDWADGAQAQASDVWSFGVVVWEIMTGEIPWHGATVVQLVSAAMAGETLPIPAFPECPDLCAIVADCWSVPGMRPSFTALESRVARLRESAPRLRHGTTEWQLMGPA